MTNAKEMAQKGFDTGFTDTEGHELHVGDYVRICGHIGKIVFSCGAFGIFIADEVPWDTLEELVRKDSGNRPSFLYNDNFISFWEIVWNLSEDTDEPCESIKLTGFYDTFDEAFGKMKELIAESVNDVFDEDATADDVEDMEDYNVFVHSNKDSQDNGAPLAFATFCDDYPNREWTVLHI